MAPSTRGEPAKDQARNSRKAPTAAKMGANDGPGMWMPSGVRGSMRAFRDGPAAARASRRNWSKMTTKTSAKTATGSSAISPPQSGMTNWDVKSRMLVQIFGGDPVSAGVARSRSVVRRAGDEDVGHDAIAIPSAMSIVVPA